MASRPIRRTLVPPVRSLYLDKVYVPRLAAFREPATMSKPHEIETAEFELLISPSAGETSEPRPATTTVHVDISSVSHTGKVRSHNEDHFLVSRFSRKQEVLQTNLPPDCPPRADRR